MSKPHDMTRSERRRHNDRLLAHNPQHTIPLRAARASSEAKGRTGLPLTDFVLWWICEGSKRRADGGGR